MRATFPIAGMKDNPVGRIHFFFGLGDTSPVYDLSQVNDEFKPGVPRGILLIACTAGSDYVCLDLRGGRETVVFWDNRPFWGNGVWREPDLHPVASSFADLIRAMEAGPVGAA